MIFRFSSAIYPRFIRDISAFTPRFLRVFSAFSPRFTHQKMTESVGIYGIELLVLRNVNISKRKQVRVLTYKRSLDA